MLGIKEPWTLQGKTVLLTGATQGIGRVAAFELAKLGPKLVLFVRDERRGQALVQALKASSGNQDIELLLGDLSVQADVRRAAAEFLSRHPHLHVLLNNAGAWFTSRQLSKDGIEMTFALNHLGYFLLTELLLDRLKATANATENASREARIINVASNAHHRAKDLDFGDLMSERRYRGFPVYSRSKLCNILFTYELGRRLEAERGREERGRVTVNCLHPGFVASGFGHNNGRLMSLAMTIGQLFAISKEAGARTLIYLASSPEVSGVTGKYFVKCKEARSSALSQDTATARKLWELSEALLQPKD